MKSNNKQVSILGVIILLFFLSFKAYYIISSYDNNAYTSKAVENGGDAAHYLKIAKNIYSHKTFSDNNSAIPTQSATWRPPIWPLTLSTFFYLTSSPLGLIIFKSILELFLIILSFRILRKYGKFKGILLLPFLLLFIEPQYLKYSITFLSESLSAVLMLLLVLIYSLSLNNKKLNVLIPILSAFVVLCHPVSIFFVTCIFGFYVLFSIKRSLKRVVLHTLIFIFIVVLWPIRNQLAFNEGFYLTASQGTTFSKGWNENVSTQFTNVDGDLADENLNLKYLNQNDLEQLYTSEIVKSKMLKKATLNFISQSSIKQKMRIISKKLISNFNPFPEKPKPGFLENLGSLFRVIYLLLFVQLLFRLIRKPKLNFNSDRDRVYLIVLSIFIGQLLMSVFIYTGLRFNSIYGLSLLFCFIYLNIGLLTNWLSRKFELNIEGFKR